MQKHIPNFITILNLLSGCIAITFAFEGNLAVASWLIVLAAIFDFLDGMAARLLNARSAIGKDLDSLADVISFGMAPGVIIYQLISINSTNDILPFIAFLIPAFSALRLAMFNNDTRQEETFYGLPTPANALLVASIPLILLQEKILFVFELEWFKNALTNVWSLVGFTLIMSWLLVSNIPLLSLKFKNLKWNENNARFILIILAAVLLVSLQYAAVPLIILLYIIISLTTKLS